MPVSAQTYRAFISYSHADRKAASRLFRQLGSYRLPKTATPSQQRRLGRFFMDREALVAAHDLSQEILTALEHSETLIVVCSPQAVASKWVTKEIEAFRQLRPGGVILTAIVAGDPVARTGEDACFPPILLEGAEPLAADLRKAGDGPKLGFMKLAAALSGAPLEALTRREAIRRNRRVTFITVTASLIALVMSGLAFTAVSARKDAEARRAEAEDMVDFMLGDLRDRLEPVGRLDVLDGVATKVLEYYDGQDEAGLDCEATIRKAHALHLQTQILIDRDAFEVARSQARSAVSMMLSRKQECQKYPEFRIALGHSHFWEASPIWGQARKAKQIQADSPEVYQPLYREAITHYEAYEVAISPLKDVEAYAAQYAQESADNAINFGSAYIGLGEYDRAINYFQHARTVIEPVARPNGLLPQELAGLPLETTIALKTQANAIGWAASLLESKGHLEEAIAHRQEEYQIFEMLSGPADHTQDRRTYRRALSSQLAIFRMKVNSGELAPASSEIFRLEEEVLALVEQDPSNSVWTRLLDRVRELRALQANETE